MKQKSLADTKEWKELRKKIVEARKDPEFMKFIQRLIEVSSNAHK